MRASQQLLKALQQHRHISAPAGRTTAAARSAAEAYVSTTAAARSTVTAYGSTVAATRSTAAAYGSTTAAIGSTTATAGSTAAAYGSTVATACWEHCSSLWEQHSSCWEHCSSTALESNAMVGHRMPAVAHHGDVRLISGGPLATLFSGGRSPVVHQWQIPPSDSRLHVAGGPPVAFWPLPGVMLSGAVAYGSIGAAVESTVLKHCSSYLFIIIYIWHIQHL